MRQCAKCNKTWPDSSAVCPDDGCSLLSTREMGAQEHADAVAVKAVADVDLAPGSVVGEFQVLSKIAEGGMGEVYAASHPVIGKKGCLKVLSRRFRDRADLVQRFVQEARTVNQIKHPAIVDIFSFGMLEDGRPFYVMEWLEGQDLRHRLSSGRLEVEEASKIVEQICDALEATHARGIVHRDLKPENVFLLNGPDGAKVKLLDFGVAKLSGESQERLVETRSGTFLGTPTYLAPEQARAANISEATDVYALGVMLYEVLIGEPPFRGATSWEVVANHLNQDPPALAAKRPGVPAELAQLVRAMLCKQPDDRPSVAQVKAAVVRLRTQRAPRRWWSPALAAPLAALALTWAVALHLRAAPRNIASAVPATQRSMQASASAVPVAPPTTEMPRTRPGILVIRSGQDRVSLELDGVPVRPATPLSVDGSRPHVITARAAGFRPLHETVNVPPGLHIELPIALVRQPVHASGKATPVAKTHASISSDAPSRNGLVDPF